MQALLESSYCIPSTWFNKLDTLDSPAGGRSRGPGGRTRCALLTRYAFGDDTIGSRGFIAAVTRTAGPRPFGGAGL